MLASSLVVIVITKLVAVEDAALLNEIVGGDLSMTNVPILIRFEFPALSLAKTVMLCAPSGKVEAFMFVFQFPLTFVAVKLNGLVSLLTWKMTDVIYSTSLTETLNPLTLFREYLVPFVVRTVTFGTKVSTVNQNSVVLLL